LGAAEQSFRGLGYRRARIEDVARVAGIGKGSVYLLFESKEALYLAVIDVCMSRLLDEFDDVLHGAGSAPDQLQGVVRSTIDAFARDGLLRVSLMGSAQDRTEQQAFRHAAIAQRVRVGALLEQGLRQGIAEGTIRASLDVERTATVMFEMGWSVVRAELEGVLTVPLPLALAAMSDIMGLGLVTRTRG
jgi:AcrR family transcriptional regulator